MSYNIQHDGIALGRRRYSNTKRPVKRAVDWQGLPLSIEIEVGDTKSGVDERGQPWSHEYQVPYGEIPSSRTLADGDGVDVYLGNSPSATLVYVIHQCKMDGSYDEDKVMLSFPSEESAIWAYRVHGPPYGFGSMDTMTVDQFKHGYLAANRKHK